MINLSVNVNKIATLRNARGGNVPDVLQVAMDCERFGANGITVHPRPDERHIRRSDVLALRPLVRTEFNIEGYPSEQFMELVLSVRPTQATLVPDGPNVLTSSAGWDVVPNMALLTGIVDRLKEALTWTTSVRQPRPAPTVLSFTPARLPRSLKPIPSEPLPRSPQPPLPPTAWVWG